MENNPVEPNDIYEIPTKLYKYQSIGCGSHTLENLRNGQIWFSKPDKLNDPFDCAIHFNIKGTTEEYLELYKILVNGLTEPRKLEKIKEVESTFLTNGNINSAFKAHTNEVQLKANLKNINDHNSQMGVACFSETFDNILMWSHYANGHKGLCLEFDTNSLPFQDREKLHHVIYSDSFPTLKPAAVFQNTYIPIDSLITKSKDWVYEREWRLIKDKGDSALEYDPRALTAIYFGCSMPDDQIKQICSTNAKSAACLFKMRRSDIEFNLIQEKYHCM